MLQDSVPDISTGVVAPGKRVHPERSADCLSVRTAGGWIEVEVWRKTKKAEDI